MGERPRSQRAPTGPDPGPRSAGRPQRLPVDQHPVADGSIDGPRRMAWLLATSRLLGPATSSLTREQFIARLRADGLGIDAPRLSRLESGSQRPTLPMLSAYASHTGLGPGVLTAVDSLLTRATGERPALHHLASAPADLDLLIERAPSGRADALDWLRLATGLTRYERVYVHGPTWADVVDHLLSELTRAVGPAFVARHEAAVILLSHDHVRSHVTRSLGRFVMDPAVQSVTPALTLLAEVGDDVAADLLLRLMGDASPLVRHGARAVVATLAGRGGLGPARSAVLEQHVSRELAKGGPHARRLDALELVADLPEGSLSRVLNATDDASLRRRALLARRQRETVEPDVARSTSEQAAAEVERAVGRRAHDADQMLVRLVRESLFHLRRDRRHLAAALLGASHYAPALAGVALELTRSEDDLVAATSWSLLRRLGHAISREDLAPRVLDEERPDLYPRALITLGSCHGPLPGTVADRLAAEAVHHPMASSRHAALFVLGMTDAPALGRLTEVETTRRGARWWLVTGPAVLDEDARR